MRESPQFLEESPDSPDTVALLAELEQQVARVAVVWDDASEHIMALSPVTETEISEHEIELTVSLDVAAIVEVLRSLPDRAGTVAFIAAYRQRVDLESSA